MEEPTPDKNGLHGVEVFYVDSHSADDSRERAAALGVQVLVIEGSKPTAALARNTGWRQARGQYVLFLDGDTILAPGFANAALADLRKQPEVAVVWGHRREIAVDASVYNRVLDLDWIYRPGLSAFCGGDALMRISALQAVDGYDDSLPAGEEPDLCRRMRALGLKVLHIDEPMTGHDMNMHRFSQYWRRSVRSGYAFAQLADRYRNTSDPLWLRDQKRNFVTGTFWPLTLLLAVASCVYLGWLGSIWIGLPLIVWIVLALAASLRSARKLRWKNASAGTLMLAGLHSHLQQLPILVGQLQFLRDRANKRQRGLIEYKGVND
jgi:cellulose synthase/poly-beta-1,6-N-acetylglucosamine synthase-like glycosyltransferase